LVTILWTGWPFWCGWVCFMWWQNWMFTYYLENLRLNRFKIQCRLRFVLFRHRYVCSFKNAYLERWKGGKIIVWWIVHKYVPSIMARDVRHWCESAASIHSLGSYTLLYAHHNLNEFAYISRVVCKRVKFPFFWGSVTSSGDNINSAVSSSNNAWRKMPRCKRGCWCVVRKCSTQWWLSSSS